MDEVQKPSNSHTGLILHKVTSSQILTVKLRTILSLKLWLKWLSLWPTICTPLPRTVRLREALPSVQGWNWGRGFERRLFECAWSFKCNVTYSSIDRTPESRFHVAHSHSGRAVNADGSQTWTPTWKWDRYVLPKRLYSYFGLHTVIILTTTLWIFIGSWKYVMYRITEFLGLCPLSGF
jgi:hypothetical protein